MNVIFIGLGGAIGAMLRYGCVTLATRLFGPGFPWGVFFANVAGSFAMGLAAAILMEKIEAPRVAALVMPGILGGFTTFSAYSLDAIRLIEGGRVGAGAAYIGGSVALALIALIAGLMIGRTLT